MIATADELYCTTSNTIRISVKTAIEDLFPRIARLEQNQVTPESVGTYIFLNGYYEFVVRRAVTICLTGQRVGAWVLILYMCQAVGLLAISR